MVTATLARGMVLPPVPAWYDQPSTIEDLPRQTVGKVLNQFDLPHQPYPRWEGLPDGAR